MCTFTSRVCQRKNRGDRRKSVTAPKSAQPTSTSGPIVPIALRRVRQARQSPLCTPALARTAGTSASAPPPLITTHTHAPTYLYQSSIIFDRMSE